MPWAQPSSWLQLPACFYQHLQLQLLPRPELLWWNAELATRFGLPDRLSAAARAAYAQTLSGARAAEGAQTLALAYAGHQFGHFALLGDGRAALLGEMPDLHAPPMHGQLPVFDVQLKGSGPTAFARRGDGLAALGPMLREVIVSEAMFALGVPTTRALALCSSGYTARRERPEPAAVLTRLAASHVRVGTFEWAAWVDDERRDAKRAATRALLQFAGQRHGATDALGLLQGVCARQARLLVQWMQLGFVHGVMNTDNMSIAGETLDYGPCAFVDAYIPQARYSAIDHMGRYAWHRQYSAGRWNLARLADCLLPCMAPDQKEAIALASACLQDFQVQVEQGDAHMRRAKLGLALAPSTQAASDSGQRPDAAMLSAEESVARRWWQLLERDALDYTNAHRALLGLLAQAAGADPQGARVDWQHPRYQAWGQGRCWDEWRRDWLQLCNASTPDPDPIAGDTRRLRLQQLQGMNPARIARNHRVQAAVQAAELGDWQPLQGLMAALRAPYSDEECYLEYCLPPLEHEKVRQTFCGT